MTATIPSSQAAAAAPPSADGPVRRGASSGFGPLTGWASVALTLTSLATAVSYCRIFPDWSYLWPMAATVVVTHVVLAVCRWFHRGLIVSMIAGAAAIATAIGLLSFPDTLAVVVPTRATWDAAWQTIADSFATFQSTVSPVPSDGGFALAATGGLALVALVSDAFAFRAYGRVEAVVPAALMFAVAASLGADRNRIAVTIAWLAAAVITVALLRAAHSESSLPWLGTGNAARTTAVLGGAGALAVAAIVIGAVLGPRLPGAESDALIDTRNNNGEGSTILSPLVSVQARLVNRSNVELFTAEVSGASSYWRLTALSDFDGKSWTQASSYDDNLEDAFIGFGTTPVTQRVRIAELGAEFVPALFSIVDVRSTEALGFDAGTSTLIRRDRLYTGMTYEVESLLPSYDPDQLRGATVGAEVGDEFLALPDSFSNELADLAASITEGQPTAYDQALALQNYFQDNFTYDVNVPRGNGERVMEGFVNSRRGYCEQFSSTFAAFARSVGIPSRVVVGFTPGDLGEDGLLHIRGKHAHAWPEVYFDGFGWVMFEPTPGRGAPGAEAWTGREAAQDGGVVNEPADAPREGDGPQSTANGGAPPTSRAPSIPTVPLPERDEQSRTPASVAPAAATAAADDGLSKPVLFVLLGLAGLALWALAMPTVARRFSRRSVGHDPASRVSDAWRRSAASLDLLDAGRRADETPMEHAERARHVANIDEKLLGDLAQAATRATYAADAVNEATAVRCEQDAQRVARLVRQRATKQRRAAARLSPRLASRLP
jgi:transglutaminase-like putative cysteine protease